MLVVIVALGFSACSATDSLAQRAPKWKTGATKEPKPDLLTLRYKPQLGTSLYNVHTDVTQRVHVGPKEIVGRLSSNAQLALHNIYTDRRSDAEHAEHWTFERYFTSFHIFGNPLIGDSINFHELGAVKKITRLSYNTTGQELEYKVIDTLRLLNTEAQANLYYFQPPRIFVPLPERQVTYGDTWSDTRSDTIIVHDTVNIGVTDGKLIYAVRNDYTIARLKDSLGSSVAMIVGTQTGEFTGQISNSITQIVWRYKGPISGHDTTYLNLFTGLTEKRTSSSYTPVMAEQAGSPAILDELTSHTELEIDESNARHVVPKD